MVRIKISGSETNDQAAVQAADAQTVSFTQPDAELHGITHVRTFEIKTRQRGDEDVPEAFEVRENGVVELVFEDGIRMVTSVERLQEQLSRTSADRGLDDLGDSDGLELTPYLTFNNVSAHATSRGLGGGLVLRFARFFEIDETIGRLAALELAERIENRLQPGPGLYRVAQLVHYVENFIDDPATLPPSSLSASDVKALQDGTEAASQPYLLFLHGTSSRTLTSFGGLQEHHQPLWERLEDLYGKRWLAFEHRTWTQSPVENAVALLQSLPVKARLHVLSYSRGGLIGELLCCGALINSVDLGAEFEQTGTRLFERSSARERNAFLELVRLLREKQPRIERFVRVACPARGTTLLSGRLDEWLSIVTSLIETAVGGLAQGLAPSVGRAATKTVVAGLHDLLFAFAEQRTDPETLPGLAAQIPGSPLLSWLNQTEHSIETDLSIISGDIEGEGLFGRLKVWLTDRFYRQEHDLVVDTASMYGGLPRHKGHGRFFFDQGAKVHHFRYFHNPRTAERIVDGLTFKNEPPEAFLELSTLDPDPTIERALRAAARGDDSRPLTDPPVVVLLPGIMGSELSVTRNGERNTVWLDFSDIAKGHIAHLAKGADVESVRFMESAYEDLAIFLERTHKVIRFHYDWRASLREAGAKLAERLQLELEQTSNTQPIRLLAHSMGGLVVRAMIAQHEEVWTRLREREGFRLIQLGTPNKGSYVIPRILTGRESILRLLALVDTQHNLKEVTEIVRQFQGLLEMLPTDGPDTFFDFRLWKKIHDHDGKRERWARPLKDDLTTAKTLRDALEAQLEDRKVFDPEHVIYVAGQAPRTPTRMNLVSRRRVQFYATAEGDGRVTWESGIPKGIPTWYMPVKHGQLLASKPDFPALLDLLGQGWTHRLPQSPPIDRGESAEILMADEDPVIQPSSRLFNESVLDIEPRSAARAPQVPIRVSVAHGNLAFARHPLLVGHYEDDPIVSAEAALDWHLAGLLSKRHRLDRYPGPVGTAHVVFARPGHKPEGAIVVGLGKVGELVIGRLREAISHGLLEYAQRVAEHNERGELFQTDLAISSLLVGSSEGGVPMADSLRALLQAIDEANAHLAEAKPFLRFSHLEIVELYEDIAIEALHTLKALRTDPALERQRRAVFKLSSAYLRTLPGRRRQIWRRLDRNWWHRTQIKHSEDTLHFDSLSRKARADKQTLQVDVQVLNELLEDVTRQDEQTQTTCEFLFEMLLPNAFKDQAPDERHVQLILNRESAVYPWEMLIDPFRSPGRTQAQALRAGMIRQLTLDPGEGRAAIRYADANSALVIGDPDHGVKKWKILFGAQNEAKAVHSLLGGHGFDVGEPMVRRSAKEILLRLIPGNHRILHIAAHGTFITVPVDGKEKRMGGLVLGEKTYLDAHKVEQMRRVPELVFLNCCHLGKIDPSEGQDQTFDGSRPELAANLAEQFIRMGAKAVVAAGWAVDDRAAKVFAETFYQNMLDGQSFGIAVLQARKEALDSAPNTNTWGAYQCYGDPHYVLVDAKAASGSSANRRIEHVSPAEMEIALENALGRAETTTADRIADLRRELLLLQRQIPGAWKQYGRLHTALGKAFAEVGMFASAIRCYRDALTAGKADSTLEDVEQLANIECRLATMLMLDELRMAKAEDARALAALEKDCSGPACAEIDENFQSLSLDEATTVRWRLCEDLLKKSETRLRLLDTLGQTIERSNLLGAVAKRCCMIRALMLEHAREVARTSGKQTQDTIAVLIESLERELNQALEVLCGSYKKAFLEYRSKNRRPHPYPLHSWLVGTVLLDKVQKPDLDHLLEIRELARQQDSEEPSFWNGIIKTENQLLRYLTGYKKDQDAGKENDVKPAQLTEGYKRAFKRGASPRQVLSVLEHLHFIFKMLEIVQPSEDRAKLALGVKEVYEAFRQATGARSF